MAPRLTVFIAMCREQAFQGLLPFAAYRELHPFSQPKKERKLNIAKIAPMSRSDALVDTKVDWRAFGLHDFRTGIEH